VSDQGDSKSYGGTHIGGNARVAANNIAGGHIFSGENHFHSAKADDPYIVAVSLSVDRFLYDLPGHTKLFFRDADGAEQPIEFQEDVARRPYLIDLPAIIEETLILRVDASSLKAAIVAKAVDSGKKVPTEPEWNDLVAYFHYQQVVLINNIARTGKLALRAGLGVGAVGSASAISALWATSVYAVPFTGGLSLLAIPAGVLGGRLLKNKLRNNAHFENQDRLSAFLREGVNTIQSYRQRIIDKIVFSTSAA